MMMDSLFCRGDEETTYQMEKLPQNAEKGENGKGSE